MTHDERSVTAADGFWLQKLWRDSTNDPVKPNIVCKVVDRLRRKGEAEGGNTERERSFLIFICPPSKEKHTFDTSRATSDEFPGDTDEEAGGRWSWSNSFS